MLQSNGWPLHSGEVASSGGGGPGYQLKMGKGASLGSRNSLIFLAIPVACPHLPGIVPDTKSPWCISPDKKDSFKTQFVLAKRGIHYPTGVPQNPRDQLVPNPRALFISIGATNCFVHH